MWRTCAGCGAQLHGRADARYCSPACRQRAHRKRRRPHKPQPYTNTEHYPNTHLANCRAQGHPSTRKINAALNLRFYDPHLATGCFQEFYRADDHPLMADDIDQFIEWLSVVRDGLRGMNWPERIAASVKRCQQVSPPSAGGAFPATGNAQEPRTGSG
jgi:hypothetical protein